MTAICSRSVRSAETPLPTVLIARSQRVRPFGRPDDRLRDEAIQLFLILHGKLDCFAPLAMAELAQPHSFGILRCVPKYLGISNL